MVTQTPARRAPARKAWLAALCGLLVVGCQTVSTTAPGAVGVERRQVMLVSEADVEESAVQAYAGELRKAHDEGRLNVDADQLPADNSQYEEIMAGLRP